MDSFISFSLSLACEIPSFVVVVVVVVGGCAVVVGISVDPCRRTQKFSLTVVN
jgi:hypothetical protein